ncbi:hypothetical protein EYF80_015295 [Liparis tanakae]|uniref:Uncharacterized protein n=1 Tax=Liparis tanakae TaxID=230148 RepID=A0A4Z2IAT2_9TELE|nr:hypothetical protein EYF80_015295 [Liparis tanakae]
MNHIAPATRAKIRTATSTAAGTTPWCKPEMHNMKPSRSPHCDKCHTPSTTLVVTQASAVSCLESGALFGQLM